MGDGAMIAKTVCLAVAILFVTTSMTSCATPHQITSGGTNQCINVVNHGYPVAGTQLAMKPCDPWQNQQWTVNNGQITGVAGFCVDVQGSAAADGTPVIYVPCNGSPSQNWTVANGTIVGIGGKCVDISGGGGPVTGAPLILAVCNGSPSQQWVLH
jgi:Ricin-type beta-trefoil lectin domain